MGFAMVKNLDKIPVKGASINKVPGLGNQMISTENFKTVVYYMKNPKGVFRIVFGSKTPDFNKLGFVEVFGSDLKKSILFTDFKNSAIVTPKSLAKIIAKMSQINPRVIDTFIAKKVSKKQLLKFLVNPKALTEAADNNTTVNVTEDLLKKLVVEAMKEERASVEKKHKEALENLRKSFENNSKKSFFTPENFKFIFTAGIAVFFMLLSIFKGIKYRMTEKHAESTLENKVNKTLFQGQTGKESAFDDFVETSDAIKNLVNNPKAKSLILTGPPGMSKTYTVRRTLHFLGKNPGKDYIFMRGGSVSTGELYQMLYDHRDKLIVLDDFDSPLQDPVMINILKSVTDSYNIRIVTVPQERSRAAAGSDEPSSRGLVDLPTRFEFKGKILVVTNLLREELNKALISRAPTLEVNYNSKKILAIMKKIMKYMLPGVPMKIKQEAVNYAKEQHAKNPSKVKLDFRALQQCMEVRVSMPKEWKKIARIILGAK